MDIETIPSWLRQHDWYVKHQLWIACEPDGSRADLSGANLSGADLREANLREANLSGANLREANLSEADLSGADLSGADLSRANLSGADLSGADLREANLREANLSEANLREANLSEADLSGADLSGADLSRANLSGADLSGADLSRADLRRANLSLTKGVLSATDWLTENFEQDDLGIIVFKRIGDTSYNPPSHWVIEPGQFLTEVVNPVTTVECGCGVNFGTRRFVDNNYTSAQLWMCRIRWIDLAGVVVPYMTDGKARCARLELLAVIED